MDGIELYGQILPLPPQPTDEEVFFQDMMEVEEKVKNKLVVYIAYELKERDAIEYLSNTKGEFPHLKREAELRGIPMKGLAELIIEKAAAFRKAVRETELLRIEYNVISPTLKTYDSRLELRDKLLQQLKDMDLSSPN